MVLWVGWVGWVGGRAPPICSKGARASASSRADWKRPAGSLMRQRRTTAMSSGGTPVTMLSIGLGSLVERATRVAAMVAPPKASTPVSAL